MGAVTTTEDFDFEWLEMGDMEPCSYFSDEDKEAKSEYMGYCTLVKLDGFFKLKRHSYRGTYRYRLTIDYGQGDTKNLRFFGKLKKEVGELCGMNKMVVIGEPLDSGSRPDGNVNARFYSSLYEKPSIPIGKLVNGKRERMDGIDELVDKEFHGSCMINIDKVKIDGTYPLIDIEVGELLVRSMDHVRSYFKEYEVSISD